MQIQMIPVPKDVVKSLKSAFFETAALSGIDLSTVEEEQDVSIPLF